MKLTVLNPIFWIKQINPREVICKKFCDQKSMKFSLDLSLISKQSLARDSKNVSINHHLLSLDSMLGTQVDL